MKIFDFPSVQPIQKEIDRPFWSVMIPTYNGTDYLEKTLKSVLEQDPGLEQMQIEVIDDCSTKDNPEKLVREIGQGRISFVHQSENLGQIKTWNNCIQRAYGHWVHILHQDDVVMPGFYDNLQKLIQKEPQIGAAFCRNIYMDEDGHWLNISDIERREPGILENWLELIATKQRIQFPSIVVKRSTYEKLGGFCPDAYSASDWEMWKRIAANYLVAYEPQVLACFRLHSASESSRLIKSGANISHTLQTIEISKYYLPDDTAEKLSRKARENYAIYALYTASDMFSLNEYFVAFSQIKEAFKCSYSLLVIITLMKVLIKAITQLITRQKNK
ncbi:MAG: glycosyltransferase [Calothrix sp. SM1_7_51]|nr:glycosyltransferase [Calothrix sp. SM1_7_51]